jgi:hypothetical protein
MTPSGIEPATFRFVAQYLDHCATISGPPQISSQLEIRQDNNRKLEPLHTFTLLGFVMGLNVVGREYMTHLK